MAQYIPNTVSVTVSLEGRQVSSAGFSTAMFLAVHNLTTPRQTLYASADELIADGFASGSPAVEFASLLFSGRQAPDLVRIGRLVPSAYTVKVNSSVIGDDNITINMKIGGTNTVIGYTVDGSEADFDAIMTAFAAVLEAHAGITSATPSGDTVTIVPASTTTPFSLGIDENTTIYTETTETVDDALLAIRAETEDFAILAAEMHDKGTQEDLAEYAESHDMIYVYSTQDTETIDGTSTDDIMYNLKDKEFEYSCGFYNKGADKYFGEGALVGTFASQDPSYKFTANLQSLKGLSTDSLTSGNMAALAAKNGNWYIQEGGVGTFHSGFTPSGDYLDRVRFARWINLRSQESMFGTLKRAADRSSGVGYNDKGIQIVESNLRTDVINVGIRNGAILTGQSVDSVTGDTISYNPIISPSTRANQTNANIASRLWTGFEVEVVYNSSIHHIENKTFIVNNRTAV